MFNRYMQYRRDLAKVVLIWFGVAAVVGALSLAAGLWLGREVLNPTTDLEAEVQELRAQLEEAGQEYQTLVESLSATSLVESDLADRLTETDKTVASLQMALAQEESKSSAALERVASLEAQTASLQTGLAERDNKIGDLDALAETVENHRLLLVELRRDFPTTREESFDYWNNMKAVAAKADPALATQADRVLLRIDNYYDWNDRRPQAGVCTQEYEDWLIDHNSSGAAGYGETSDAFNREALLSVITKMEGVISQLN